MNERSRAVSAVDETSSPPPAAAPSVAGRAVRGAAWFTVARAFAHGLRALRLLFLAHLLGEDGPTELGIFGVAMLVIQIAESLSQTGLSQAIIQRRDDVEPYLPTAWTAQLLRGVLLSATLFALAPFLAELFEKPEATAPLRVLSAVPLIRGFTSIGVVFFLKDLAFRQVFLMDVGIAVVELIVCCALAWAQPDVWALVWGNLAGVLYGLVASYVLSKRRARLGFSLARMRELSAFGVWVFVAALVSFALTSGGDAVIGKLLPAAALGIYQMASRFSNMPAFELARVITTISFPAFSLLQSDPERMRRAFLKAYFFSSVVCLAIAGAIIALAHDVVAILLPDQWSGVAPVMQLLAVWGAMRGMSSSQSAFFYAAGRPGVATLVSVLMLVVFALGVLPAVDAFGVVGVAGLLAAVGVFAQLLIFPLVGRMVGVSGGAVLIRTVVSLSAPSVGLLLVLAASSVLDELAPSPALRLIAFSAAYAAGLILALAAWERLSSHKVSPVLREIWSNVRRRKDA